MTFAIFVCFVYLDNQCFAEETRKRGSQEPSIVYHSKTACQLKVDKSFAATATANKSYHCVARSGTKWEVHGLTQNDD